VINEYQAMFDLVVATQDWHPANHGSFAINHRDKNPGEIIDLNGLDQVLWPVHCVQNTFGADFIPDLDRE
jgi:nicotinamidase/pyrazinamidase